MSLHATSSRRCATRRLALRCLEPLEGRLLLSTGFLEADLTADRPGVALRQDANLVNAWGMDAQAGGPFWIAANATSLAVVLTGAGTTFQSPVAITGPTTATVGHPTGVVALNTTGFPVLGGLASASFAFATLEGTIDGWATGSAAQVVVDNSARGAEYTGLTSGTINGSTFLYAANFTAGTIDVFNQFFTPTTLAGNFTDATGDTAGFAPFNIANINNSLYVSYAKRNLAGTADQPGLGNGFVDVFDLNGRFLNRLVSHGQLNSPWGMALAPASFGAFAGALLVGNFGDGAIHAYDPISGNLLGQVADTNGAPIIIDGLWSLKFGNGGPNAPTDTLFFTAGPSGEAHGLFGSLTPVTTTTSASLTRLALSTNTAALGEPVTLTATVSGSNAIGATPTGRVTFNDGAVSLGSATLVNGQASLTLSTLDGGSHTLRALYSGDSNFAASTSAAQILTVFGDVPFGYFDEQFYLATYPDVAAAVADHRFASGLTHFEMYGNRELRNPSPLIDQQFYLATYPDVAAAVQSGTFVSGFDHFVQFGDHEGRSPSVYFDARFYLSSNPDVAAAVADGRVSGPFAHFVAFGENEERSAIDVFNATFYLAHNPDVAAAIDRGEFTSSYQHFLLFGNAEERQPSTEFDPQFYLHQNPDVAAAVQSGMFVSALDQWLKAGRAEGRAGHA